MNTSNDDQDLHSLLETIRNRRSIFPQSFTEVPVRRNDIELMLASANYAPTHRLTQPWRFKVLQGKALHRLSESMAQYYLENTDEESISEKKLLKTRQKPLQSSAVIAICMFRDPAESVPEWEEVAAVACAVQNMWLVATRLGIGGYWSTPSSKDAMTEVLGLHEAEKCLGFFYLGNHKMPRMEAKRSAWQDKVNWLEK
ncbi:MAG: nitroreductase [Saprospiraceae bacterium]|nr:nitroreductase [Saprospiraceae bacterium]